jgi:hypothetical protein
LKTALGPSVAAPAVIPRASDAGALVVAKLDRLSRSMLDFTAVMAKATKQGWALVALDCAVDTTTAAGEAMANVLATFAQFERRLISQRTKEALAVKKAPGVRLGRPLQLPEGVSETDRDRRRPCWLVSFFVQAVAVLNLSCRSRVAELVEQFVLGWGDIAQRFV